MGRRRRQSGAEDMMDLVARLPWWAGVLLATGAYAVFHWLALRPLPEIKSTGDFSGNFVWIWLKGVSVALQYLVPGICLIGALVSFLQRRKRAALAATVTASPGAQALEGMSWREFEMLVGEAFRLQGYQVEELGGPQADGGVDLVLCKAGETFLVQCKQWKAFKVGVDVVRQLYGVMAARGAAGGMVVTSGRFTDEAVAFAAGRNVRLVDGPALLALLQQARKAGAARAPEAAAPRPAAPPSAAMPACPKCGARMLKRMARQGSNAGSQFWGCSTYPKCRGTR